MRTIYVSPDFPLNRRMRKDIRRGKLQVVREGGERLSLGGESGNRPPDAYLLIHSQKAESNAAPDKVEKMDFAEAMGRTLNGLEYPCRWSVGEPSSSNPKREAKRKVFRIRPGNRVFLYRSGEKLRGILGVGKVVLPGGNRVPMHGSAVYEDERWQGGGGKALYIQVLWEKVADPERGRILIPFERLCNEEPFFRVFTDKNKKPFVHRNSWRSICGIIAQSLDAKCDEAFRGFGVSQNPTASTDAFHSSRQTDSEERKKIEVAAVNATREHYHALGCEVRSRERDNVGWDLDVFKDEEIFRRVEVKGTKSPNVQVDLPPNEYEKSQVVDLYRLAVVRNALNEDCHPVCAIYERDGNKWLLVSGEENGDNDAPGYLEMEEKKFAVVRQPK